MFSMRTLSCTRSTGETKIFETISDDDESDSERSYAELVVDPSDLDAEGESTEEEEEVAANSRVILQFNAPIYFVEEPEVAVVLEVMRLGHANDRISCHFYTEDLSAKSGERYEATEGKLVFEPGDVEKSISIPLIVTDDWNPTLEFNVCLSRPRGCELGRHLRHARVKVMDETPFPSFYGGENFKTISSLGLFWEFWKMNFDVPGIAWRTIVISLLEQLRNVYTFYKVWATAYMLDHLFQHDPAFTTQQRTRVAFLLGLGYILPMMVFHAFDFAKVYIDLSGHTRLALQKGLLAAYLNYSDRSREKVLSAEIEAGIGEESANMAEGYTVVFAIVRSLGKLGILIYFVVAENAQAMKYVVLMPVSMLIFAWLRFGLFSKAIDYADEFAVASVDYVAEVSKNYRLMKNYTMRPYIFDKFLEKLSAWRVANQLPRAIQVNNDYFAQWLGPLFAGAYVMFGSQSVFSGELRPGQFIATLSVFIELGNDFSETYKEFMEITAIAGTVRGMTKLYNRPSDLPAWKETTEKRRAATLELAHVVEHATSQGHPFPTDELPILFRDVGFSFSHKVAPILRGITATVPQGSMVMILGKHGQGRQTFLRLIGGEIFPTQGVIFIPSHLRVLHVSQEVMILDANIQDNLLFGRPANPSIERMIAILEKLKAWKVIQALKNEVEQKSDKPSLSAECTEEPDEDEANAEGEETADPEVDVKWEKRLNFSERAKLHLTRALLMSPEVMVLQRPLMHFNPLDQKLVLDCLLEHVRNRGLGEPTDAASVHHRRPRTVFLSIEKPEFAKHADIVLSMNESNAPSSVSITRSNEGPSPLPAKLPHQLPRRYHPD